MIDPLEQHAFQFVLQLLDLKRNGRLRVPSCSAAVYKGLGSLFGAVFPGVPTWVWTLGIAVLTAVYLVAGGYIATSYTNLVQGVIMITGIILLVITVLWHEKVSGIDAVIPTLLMEVLSGGKLGLVLLAIIMVLLLSASMSTLQSVVLTSASAVAVDLIPWSACLPGIQKRNQIV